MSTRSEESIRVGEAETKRALGLFLLFFGAVLLVAIFFTPNTIGKMLNLASGALLVLIGGLLVRHGQRVLGQHRNPNGSASAQP